MAQAQDNPTKLTATEVNPHQTAGRAQLGGFAPKFAELNDDVLFGQVWSRTNKLSKRDRSLITVTSLISQGITDSSLVAHLQGAKQNGITRSEIAEIITQVAFYAGWPKAWAAFRLAKDIWSEKTEEADAKAAFQNEMIFPIGEPNTAYAKYFVGNSYLTPISTEQVKFSNVTFEPGCRNNWHIHHATKGGGQMLVGVAGRGWYQEEGKPAVAILPGTVIHIPANVKHWHGAAKDSWFAHLAFELDGENTSNEWLEPVSESDYNNLRGHLINFYEMGSQMQGCKMNILLNIIWVVFGGLMIAIEYAISRVVMMIIIFGIPFGLQHFKLMKLALLSFGKYVS